MPTKIPWADETFNPTSGCSGPTGTPENPKVCTYCYARRMAIRLQKMPQSAHKYRNGFRPTFHPEEIEKFKIKANRWREAKRIFVGSMSDIMDPGFSQDEIQQVIDVAESLPRHTFLFLTKRPERLQDFDWPDNSWIGATTTGQEAFDRAMKVFKNCAGPGVRFVSVEPIQGPISLGRWARPIAVKWIIIGAQSGSGAKAPDPEWVRDLTAQAQLRSIPTFHKDNLHRFFGDEFSLREFPG
jgi:protein gp37